MKKIFYTLVIALFTLNISAQSVYIVAEDANAPDIQIDDLTIECGYSLTPISGTNYKKAWEISGGTDEIFFFAEDTNGNEVFSEFLNEPSKDLYYKIIYSDGIWTINTANNNTYSAKLYINSEVENKANLSLLTYYKTTTTTNNNILGFKKEIVYSWESFWNENTNIQYIYLSRSGRPSNRIAPLNNGKEYVLTYDYSTYHIKNDALVEPNNETFKLALVEVSNHGTIEGDGNIIENDSYGFFKEVVRTKTYTAADVENWIWISSPYRANIVIKDAIGNQLTHAYYFNGGDYRGGDYLLKYYDTQAAANGSDNNWVDTRNNLLEAGKGYILGINPEGLTTPFTVTITSTPEEIIDSYTRIGFGHNDNITSSIDSKHSNLHLVGTSLYNTPRGLNFGGKVAHFCLPAANGYDYAYEFNLSETDYSKIEYLAPYTAFFMQYAGDFYFHNYNGTEVAPRAPRRTVDVEQEMEIYELLLNNEKTTIMMDADGTEGYTINEDFIYFTQTIDGIEIANQFYTIDGNDQLSFNHRKNQNQTITLGGLVATTDEYTISLNGINTKAQSVTLFDALENRTTELTTNNYTFTAKAGSINNRFIITFSFAPGITTDAFAIEANQLVVSGNAQNCTISNLTIGEEVMIFDTMGRMIYNAQANANSLNITLNAGTYIVRQTNNFAKFVIR